MSDRLKLTKMLEVVINANYWVTKLGYQANMYHLEVGAKVSWLSLD